MMSVYNHVLEEVESLNRKYTPVSYMASGICFIKCFLRARGFSSSLALTCDFTFSVPVSFVPAL